jgi:putative ribosome biogenesis GTPase RsgA
MEELDLLVPDRFDMLQRRAPDRLGSIIVPVDEALHQIDALSVDLRAAGRGGFLIFRGDSGSGKSTFLNTLDLFRNDVDVIGIYSSAEVGQSLRSLKPTQAALRVLAARGESRE